MVSPENIITLKNGGNLSKIIVVLGLKYNKNLLESKDNEIKFSKQYQLLSKNTALFGEILKYGTSTQNELIKVNINEERQKISSNIGRAIYPLKHMMLCKKKKVSTAVPRMVKSAMGNPLPLIINDL